MEGIKIVSGQVIFDSDLNSHLIETDHACGILGSLRKVDRFMEWWESPTKYFFLVIIGHNFFLVLILSMYQVLYFGEMCTGEMMLK